MQTTHINAQQGSLIGTRHYYADWVWSCTNFVHNARLGEVTPSTLHPARLLKLGPIAFDGPKGKPP